MPWRDFANDWLASLTESYQAVFLGVEKKYEMAIFELDRRIPTEREMRLTFPCGQGLTGRPAWHRTPGEGENTTIAGFETHELGLLSDDLAHFQEAQGSRNRLRLPVRVWAKFQPLRPAATVTEDLSLSGCRLKGEHPSLLGQTVNLELDLAGLDGCAVIPSRVVWSKDGATGVCFLNLSVHDEALILKTLGEAVTSPSTFLPGQSPTEDTSCYAIKEEGPYTLLHLATRNWDFHFKFAHARVIGEGSGCFMKFYALESSPDMQKLRADLKIELERQKSLVHLYLVDSDHEVVLDLCGEELSHERVRRTPIG